MKTLLFSTLLLFFFASMNAQMTLTYTKSLSLTPTRKAPVAVRKESPKKMRSTLKRTVKIIPKEKKSTIKKIVTLYDN